MTPYARSILFPFSTSWIKPPHDYPLNTSVIETTYEVALVPVLGTGSGLFPSSTYGVSAVVLPHAFNDLININGMSIYSGSYEANLRMFAQYS